MNKYPSEVLDQVRKSLEEEKSRILKRIEEIAKQDPFSDPDRLTDNAASDREATEESDHDRYTAIVEELKSQRNAIDKALFRIADKSFGFCTSCAQMIDTDRLMLLPTAELCLTCEKKKLKLKTQV